MIAPSLALQSLTLSHFRSYKRNNLETDGRPVAIYGANGAGKTNILEAISMKEKLKALEGIIGFYLYEVSFNNKTIQ